MLLYLTTAEIIQYQVIIMNVEKEGIDFNSIPAYA